MIFNRYVSVALLVVAFGSGAARAQQTADSEPTAMSAWLAMTAHQPEGIASGTKITMRNWRQISAIHATGNGGAVQRYSLLENPTGD